VKKMNVFGIPDMNVGSRDELAETAESAEGNAFYLVFRVADTITHGYPPELLARMMRTPCEKCHHICYYDPKHFVPHTTIVCSHCKPANAINYAPEGAIKDVADALQRQFFTDFLRSYR
jgi:hypothetical protein